MKITWIWIRNFAKKLGIFQGPASAPAPVPALNLRKTLIIPSITLVTNFDNNFNGFSNNFDNNLWIIYSHYLYKYKIIRATLGQHSILILSIQVLTIHFSKLNKP